MSDPSTFIQLLPEVQDILCPHFSYVDCSLGIGPDLSRPPFNRPFRNLGQQVTFVPDSSVVEDLDRGSHYEIPLGEKAFVLTDSTEGTVMEIALEGGTDWLTPLSQLFQTIFQSKWTFLVAEVVNGAAAFHVISSKGLISDISKVRPEEGSTASFSLWIVPVSKIFAIPPPVKKVKIIKKVIKKKSPVEEEISTDGIVKKNVRKKKVSGLGETSVDAAANGTNREEGKRKELNGTNTVNEASDIPNSSEIQKKRAEEEKESNGEILNSSHSSLHESPSLAKAILPTTYSKTLANINGSERKENGDSDEEDADLTAKLRKEIMERDRLNRLGEDHLMRKPQCGSPTRTLGSIYELKSSRPPQTSEVQRSSDHIIGRSGTFLKPRSFDFSPPRTTPSTTKLTFSQIPVIALQIVLRKSFSFEELGNLRAVHPHWDEICGQLLNGAYYALLERTDRMLMKYQRKVHSDSGFHYAISLLTNIQVHILNPVDMMRAALDEGICCFPYGVIIDKTLAILDEIEKMVESGQNNDISWEGIGVLAKKASIHYRSNLEEVMEERMGTCARLKAAQRIIRMDSMIVEHNVNKLEKESVRARDDLRWELEQVQQSNAILKKENRQLKADQMRLESRIDSLENKLRSICRLLS